jgi:hypothetical protein
MRQLLTLITAATIAATPALSDGLHCLGRSPGFMMVIDGDEARFDYLGDGVFDLDPAFDPARDGHDAADTLHLRRPPARLRRTPRLPGLWNGA